MKVIITGATGMVGEGVMLVCLQHSEVEEVLLVNRRNLDRSHPKLKQLQVKDFNQLDAEAEGLSGYDACFFCAGVSSVGMDEEKYKQLTHDTTLNFARALLKCNPQMVFDYVSGSGTDSSEKGKSMWARVKGKTENDLQQLGFKTQYNFRPGFMKPLPGQRNLKGLYRALAALYPIWLLLIPKWTCKLEEVGMAMIHTVSKGYPKPTIEVSDIKLLAK